MFLDIFTDWEWTIDFKMTFLYIWLFFLWFSTKKFKHSPIFLYRVHETSSSKSLEVYKNSHGHSVPWTRLCARANDQIFILHGIWGGKYWAVCRSYMCWGGGGVNTSNMHIHKFYFRQLFIKGRQSLPIKFRHWWPKLERIRKHFSSSATGNFKLTTCIYMHFKSNLN